MLRVKLIRRIFGGTFCLLYCSSSMAGGIAGSISGTVYDSATKRGLAFVTVYLADIKAGTATDANGNYRLPNIPEGSHLFEFSHIGYGSKALQVVVSGETKLDVMLHNEVLESEAVVVTGVTRSSQLRTLPYRVDVLRAADLRQIPSSNIIDAISRKPGVSAVTTGPAIAKPFIRGLGYNRVLTVNDGVRQEGQQWGDEHGVEVDEASANRIEILKGPASLIYGSDAMAGVVNIITNVPVALNTLQANVNSNYQTNARLRSVNANLAGNLKGFSWNAYGTGKSSGDYKNKFDGRVFNSKFREANYGGYIGYNGVWGYSHLVLSSFDQRPGLIEGDRDADGNFVKLLPGGAEAVPTNEDFKSTRAFVPGQRIRHQKLASDNSFKAGKNNIKINIAFQRNRRDEFGDTDDPSLRELSFDLKTTTFIAQYQVRELRGWKPSFGVSGMLQSNENKGEEQLIPDYDQRDFGAFAYTQKEIANLTLSGGLRFDNRKLNAAYLLDATGVPKSMAFEKTFSNFSASGGLSYAATKSLTLKANIARAFRAPSIPELATNGTHEGTNRYEYGFTGLKSETSTQADGGLEVNSKHISFTLNGYVNAFNNFIFYRKLESIAGGDSLVEVDGEFINAFQFDQRRATLSGTEITVDLHPHPLDWLHFQNTFSFVRGRFKDAIEGTRDLPLIQAPRLLTELRADFSKAGKSLSNLYLKLELDNYFDQKKAFTAFDTETPTPGYSLLNAGAGTNFIDKKGKTVLSLNLAANNITDRAYQNHLSRLKYTAVNPVSGRQGVFNQGRNFSIKLNIPFSWKI